MLFQNRFISKFRNFFFDFSKNKICFFRPEAKGGTTIPKKLFTAAEQLWIISGKLWMFTNWWSKDFHPAQTQMIRTESQTVCHRLYWCDIRSHINFTYCIMFWYFDLTIAIKFILNIGNRYNFDALKLMRLTKYEECDYILSFYPNVSASSASPLSLNVYSIYHMYSAI